MEDKKVNMQISQLMQEVQNAALDSEKSAPEEGYIEDVNRRIGEIETALTALKHELAKHGLNEW